jgi:hypothetical protein
MLPHQVVNRIGEKKTKITTYCYVRRISLGKRDSTRRSDDANAFHEVYPASTAWSQLSGRLWLAGEVKNNIRFRDAADQPP